MDFSKVTRVNYAFFQLNADGDIWGTDEWGDVSEPAIPHLNLICDSLIALLSLPHLTLFSFCNDT